MVVGHSEPPQERKGTRRPVVGEGHQHTVAHRLKKTIKKKPRRKLAFLTTTRYRGNKKKD